MHTPLPASSPTHVETARGTDNISGGLETTSARGNRSASSPGQAERGCLRSVSQGQGQRGTQKKMITMFSKPPLPARPGTVFTKRTSKQADLFRVEWPREPGPPVPRPCQRRVRLLKSAAAGRLSPPARGGCRVVSESGPVLFLREEGTDPFCRETRSRMCSVDLNYLY